MATLTADRADADFPVYRPGGAGAVGFAYGVYELAANPADGDVIQMLRLPEGAKVIDGFLRGDDIDTGTEELDLDVGFAANGTDSADADAFGNFGVVTGDAVTGVKPETQIWLPLNGLLKDGPVELSAETIVQITVNTNAATGGTGTLYLGVYYIVD
jgi:hypothetical protein